MTPMPAGTLLLSHLDDAARAEPAPPAPVSLISADGTAVSFTPPFDGPLLRGSALQSCLQWVGKHSAMEELSTAPMRWLARAHIAARTEHRVLTPPPELALE